MKKTTKNLQEKKNVVVKTQPKVDKTKTIIVLLMKKIIRMESMSMRKEGADNIRNYISFEQYFFINSLEKLYNFS